MTDWLTSLESTAALANAWRDVPARARRLAEDALPVAVLVREHFWKSGGATTVWLDPETEDLHHGPTPPDFLTRPWVLLKSASALAPVATAMQLTPNPVNRLVGGPTPLAATLAGSALGAGLGYGGGLLAEKILGPDVLEKGRARRTGMILGGLMGAAPGAYLGATDMRLNAEDGQSPWAAWVQPNRLLGKEGAADLQREFDEVWREHGLPEPDPVWAKAADVAGGGYLPMIPVDAFNRVLWDDPQTPLPLRATAVGLVESASQSRGGAAFISPFDVGRIAIGMGSGLVSGMIVGKTLGALAGLTPDAQNQLKRTGAWAGALANVVPLVFGRGNYE